MAKDKGFKIDGMDNLIKMMNKLERVPQTVVTRAARAGATIPLKAARKNAPEDTGELKRGIVLKAERRTKIGKKVYDIMMDPAKNDLFVKYAKDGTRYYYPASQEYGFMTEDGRYIPGYRYLRNAMTNNVKAIEAKVVEVAGKEVMKVMRG
ncbi:HK97-gp10 family putative phage morphogenesis protein [Paenibacillus sp. JDR-2]|uniref:HK97-gp10 family putative phage morphogenesis protein n=1 Tax=Paenibacillus sp. (strain JDR-2) TaxID=324057 RepID=UPI000166A36C|nr:HK97-gp10 family putative phage morphogenesis protein [Paenibacillus sp. JDR-2]ACT00219.1 phage protein, HK97 gp10 family [Paenibacillus sp. JDR-2]